jgi:superfamily II DNA/RNA helicase
MLQLAHWSARDVLAQAGLRAAFFTGRESSAQRTRNLVDFHDDPATCVLFATDAGGVGLNLQRAASACVLLDLPWNPAVLEQRVGRIYRLGQTLPVDVYRLVTQGSIEERIGSLVSDKRALFRGLFDGTSDSVHFDRSGSFLASVHKLVETPPDAAPDDASDEAEDPASEAALETSLDDRDERAAGVHEAEDANAAGGESAAPAADRIALDPIPAPAAPDLARLFADLRVERTPSGALRIESSPETAHVLASVFEGFAEALRRATR